MKNKEDRGDSLFPYQIVDFIPAPKLAKPIFSCTFPHSLDYTVVLDSGGETRYIRCVGI